MKHTIDFLSSWNCTWHCAWLPLSKLSTGAGQHTLVKYQEGALTSAASPPGSNWSDRHLRCGANPSPHDAWWGNLELSNNMPEVPPVHIMQTPPFHKNQISKGRLPVPWNIDCPALHLEDNTVPHNPNLENTRTWMIQNDTKEPKMPNSFEWSWPRRLPPILWTKFYKIVYSATICCCHWGGQRQLYHLSRQAPTNPLGPNPTIALLPEPDFKMKMW